MQFRPCIDIHNGKVKQIVGSSLRDEGDAAKENFVSEADASWYAATYKKLGLTGGHVILLNGKDSEYYEATKAQAITALKAYPGGLQVGGGITAENASEYIEAGASHVIVTSYVFRDGRIDYENIQKLVDAVGKEHLVLDMSCRKKGDEYFVVTDRWQKFTDEQVTVALLKKLACHCDEFLIHGVDVEGKSSGVDEGLLDIMSQCDDICMTYAGGISDIDAIECLKKKGKGKINVTIGSALDMFGGTLALEDVLRIVGEEDK